MGGGSSVILAVVLWYGHLSFFSLSPIWFVETSFPSRLPGLFCLDDPHVSFNECFQALHLAAVVCIRSECDQGLIQECRILSRVPCNFSNANREGRHPLSFPNVVRIVFVGLVNMHIPLPHFFG